MIGIRDDLLVWNERVKLFAGFVNAVALGLIGFAVLKPVTEDIANLTGLTVWWGIVGLAFHGVSHYIVGHMRKVPS